jgi:integrase
MRKLLTDLGVSKLRPGPNRGEVGDTIVPGLYLIVQPSGHKSFAVRARIAGKLVKITLGSYPRLPLEQARVMARGKLELIAMGMDPRLVDQQHRLEQARRAQSTLRALAEQWCDAALQKTRPRSWRGAWQALDNHVLAHLGDTPIADVRRRDLLALLDRLDGHPGAQRHVTSCLAPQFRWAVDRELVEHNVADRLPRPRAGVRHRVLSDDEIGHAWAACDLVGPPYGPYVQLLLLTACRRGELAGLRWPEIDAVRRVLTVPAWRCKSNRELTVPLSPLAQRVLAGVPRLSDGDYVFSLSGGRMPLGSQGRLKDAFEAQLQAHCSAQGVPTFGFDLHDLRRTVRTGLSELKVPPHIAEFCLAHVVSGVQKHYDKWSYLDEKREALDAWAGKVERLIAPADNVVSLRRS